MVEKSTSPKRKILSLKERAEILRLADEKGPEVCWWIVAHGYICTEFVFSKNGGNVEAMELLLKLESVVPGDMTFESCNKDGQPRDGDNGLPV